MFVALHMKGLIDRISSAYVVAPAELEGHLLDSPLVVDTCVVGIPDEYSGEVPLAFVVPSQIALDRIKKDIAEVDKVKAEIIKVCKAVLSVSSQLCSATNVATLLYILLYFDNSLLRYVLTRSCFSSLSQTQRYTTNDLPAASNLSTVSRKTQVESCCDVS